MVAAEGSKDAPTLIFVKTLMALFTFSRRTRFLMFTLLEYNYVLMFHD